MYLYIATDYRLLLVLSLRVVGRQLRVLYHKPYLYSSAVGINYHVSDIVNNAMRLFTKCSFWPIEETTLINIVPLGSKGGQLVYIVGLERRQLIDNY